MPGFVHAAVGLMAVAPDNSITVGRMSICAASCSNITTAADLDRLASARSKARDARLRRSIL